MRVYYIHLLVFLAFSLCGCNAAKNKFYQWNENLNDFSIRTLEKLDHEDDVDKLGGVFKSNSQCLQDTLILNITEQKKGGFYVDLAANHYKSLSNTYSLERYNQWEGICIEANPNLRSDLVVNRNCSLFVNPVAARTGETITFRLARAGFDSLGGIVGEDTDNSNKNADGGVELEMLTVTLGALLDYIKAPAVMDYLSLDIEGSEYHAMMGMDFSKYTFNMITIERPVHHLHLLLNRHGYRFVYIMSRFGECFYVHTSYSKYDEIMKKYHSKELSGSTVWNDVALDASQAPRPHDYLWIPAYGE